MSAIRSWSMTQGKVLEGIFALNKPTGISSAQALRELQTHFNPSKLFAPWMAMEKSKRNQEAHNQRNKRKQKQLQVKIGHGGTLDPLATGVLIVGVGKGTKVLQTFLECTKTYETIVLFGASTDSYDRVGKILKRAPYQHITREMVEKALEQFRGKIMQLPPLYSALKMNGKPLYEYAREGKQIPREIEKRAVEVQELELLEWMEGGTHGHKLPTEEAGKAEVAVAEKLWRIEKEADAKEAAQEDSTINLAVKKRKLEDNQDQLVIEEPVSKRRVNVTNNDEYKMSGGLPSSGISEDREPAADVEQHSGRDATESKDITASFVGPPAAKIRMTVTSGFYVRSLAHDLGEAVGSHAIMAELVRTRQAQFELKKNVLEYIDLAKGEDVWGPQVEQMLDGFSADYRPFAESAIDVQVALKENAEKNTQQEATAFVG